MSQPVWKTYRNLGDVGVIYVDETGVYSPEVEIWEEYESNPKEIYPDDECTDCDEKREEHTVEAGGTGGPDTGTCEKFRFDPWQRMRYHVYRVPLDRIMAADEGEWFSDKLDLIAENSGMQREELIENFRSSDPLHRYHAYDAVASHYGWDEFDQYPNDLSERERHRILNGRREREREREREEKGRRIAQAVLPHGRCASVGYCAEHAQDRTIPSCMPGKKAPRGKGRKTS